MKKSVALFVALLAMAFLACAEEVKKEEPKKETVVAETSLKGDLGTNADNKVVLRVRPEEKGAVKAYILVGDLTEKLSALAKKHARVEVSGVLSKDGTVLKVTTVAEVEKEKKHGAGAGGHAK